MQQELFFGKFHRKFYFLLPFEARLLTEKKLSGEILPKHIFFGQVGKLCTRLTEQY